MKLLVNVKYKNNFLKEFEVNVLITDIHEILVNIQLFVVHHFTMRVLFTGGNRGRCGTEFP